MDRDSLVRSPRILNFRRGELAEDALDVHQLLAVDGRELGWRHLVLVTAENLSVREDSREVVSEHDGIRAREAHRWPMLAEPPRRRER